MYTNPRCKIPLLKIAFSLLIINVFESAATNKFRNSASEGVVDIACS